MNGKKDRSGAKTPRRRRYVIDEDELEKKVKVVVLPYDRKAAQEAVDALVDLLLSAQENEARQAQEHQVPRSSRKSTAPHPGQRT